MVRICGPCGEGGQASTVTPPAARANQQAALSLLDGWRQLLPMFSFRSAARSVRQLICSGKFELNVQKQEPN